jgi:hypothetical protein
VKKDVMSGPTKAFEGVAEIIAAAFLPAVIFLIAPAPVVERNVSSLLYHSSLTCLFLAAFGVSWLLWSVTLLFAGRRRPFLARASIAVGFFILAEDLVRPFVDAPNVALSVVMAVDLSLAALVILLVFRTPYRHLAFGAAAYASIAVAQTTFSHIEWLENVPPYLHASGTALSDTPARPIPPTPRPNVYHLILDAYPAALFLESARSLNLDFPGFRFYRNFNSMYPRTQVALPGLLRGRHIDEFETISDFLEDSAEEGFWKEMVSGSLALDLYPYYEDHCIVASHCRSLRKVMLQFNEAVFRYTIIDLWTLKLLPNALRAVLNPHGVYTGAALKGTEKEPGFSVTRLIFRTIGREEMRGTGNLNIDYQLFGLEQFEILLRQEAMRPGSGRYVFWHGMFPHGPQVLDGFCHYPIQVDESSRMETIRASVDCATRLAHRLVMRLRELGRYDDALIIIQSDHGMSDLMRMDPSFEDRMHNRDPSIWPSEFVETMSSGLMLVKFPGQRGPLEIDHAPAQMIDVAPTVLSHLGLPWSTLPGHPVDQVTSGNLRPVVFFATTRGESGSILVAKYRKHGSGWELEPDADR